jgi:sulfoxide reductase catalytic subunit YedY
MPIVIRPPWYLPEREATPESAYLGRRDFLRVLGTGTIAGAVLAKLGCARADKLAAPTKTLSAGFKRNKKYVLDRPVTDEKVVASYNNFYEFSEDKGDVAELAQALTISPWAVTFAGMVKKEFTIDVADLVKKMTVEERLYRHRCVEAWAMAVPWIGFPLKKMIEFAQPLSSAKFVRFISFMKPDEAPLQRRAKWYPWPYFEGLTINEATNELAFACVGIYGHDLPKQNGAPLRLAIPWKYGYKSAKSIVRVEFVADQPPTFWNTLAPSEYSFTSNVNPRVPHPRWSQATERMIGSGDRRPTLLYNGYGDQVASIYNK